MRREIERKRMLVGKDDPEAQLFCTAHLNEARAFPCPFNKQDIIYINNKKRIAHKTKEGNLEGFCEDFKPIKK